MLGNGPACSRQKVYPRGSPLIRSPRQPSGQSTGFLRGRLRGRLSCGPFLWEPAPPLLHTSFPSEALPSSLRCWEDSVNSSLEVLEALGGETHYKYPAFIIRLRGGTVLCVGEANTCRGTKSKYRAPGAPESCLLGAT